MTTNQKEAAAAPSEAQVPEDESIEFTKEEVDALLNENFDEAQMFADRKAYVYAKGKWMMDTLKRQNRCLKWFRKSLKDPATEKDNLCNKLDSSERNCVEAEAAMKKKEEELNAAICKLEANISSLKASLANEESQKLDALDCHKREKEARMLSEKNQDSLREELQRVEHEALGYKEKVKIHEDMYKRLQEYNTSLQQYNTKLQNDLKSATDSNLQVGREKAVILENHSTLRGGHYNMLQTNPPLPAPLPFDAHKQSTFHGSTSSSNESNSESEIAELKRENASLKASVGQILKTLNMQQLDLPSQE